ncbi:MAG: c-type cytochrome [Acidobacteria bacterium]|nr:c-type cytochrome [Acidobacteriota bacterium]
MNNRYWRYILYAGLLLATTVVSLMFQLGLIWGGRPAGTHAGSRQGGSSEVEPPGYEQAGGERIYSHYCSVCHGETGEGDGFNAFNLEPRPRNFKDKGWQRAVTDRELRAVVRDGGPAIQKSASMPPWGLVLNDRQVEHVLQYIRAMGVAPPS